MNDDAGGNAIAQEQPQEQSVVEVQQEAPKEEPGLETPKPEEKKPTGYDRVKAKNAAMAAQLEEAQRKIAELEVKTPKVEPKGKPDPKDYDGKDWSDYYADLAEWTAENKLEAKLKERESKAQEAELRKAAEERRKTFESKVSEFSKATPDFDEAIETSGIAEIPMLGAVILETDMGPQVAYYLANNPDEAEKLRGKTYGQIAAAVGKIEAKLESPKSKEVRTTQAPPPIKPVGGSAKGSFDPYASKGDDYEAYQRWRSENATQ